MSFCESMLKLFITFSFGIWNQAFPRLFEIDVYFSCAAKLLFKSYNCLWWWTHYNICQKRYQTMGRTDLWLQVWLVSLFFYFGNYLLDLAVGKPDLSWYRFFSIDVELSCSCGAKRCRGVVNDIEAEEQAAKLHVNRSELIDWKGE